ncbi:MAG: S41 family peptidase, partial [Synechococcaceae cyanobacterium]|nr:S41 family peptidase [Synechococcaceae cyanobacterium]
QHAHRLATVETYFPFYLWLAYGWDDDFAIVYRPVGQAGQVERRVAGLAYREIQRRRSGGDAGRSGAPFAFRPEPANGAGVFTVSRFADRQALDDFLRDAFARVDAQGLDRVIIDLRDNGGGSTDVSAVLLRYLAREPFRHFARYDLKVSRPIKRQLKRQLPAAVRWLPLQYLFARGRAIWGAPDGSTITVDGPFIEPYDRPRRFEGEVIVLVGPATFSTAADVAAVVQDFGLGTLVGEPTGGLGCSLGDAYAFRLPHSRLEVGVSHKYFVRPSGACGEGGVQPEHRVVATAADVAAGRDPVMAYALALPRRAPRS